ncbi:MAG: DNA-directed RNA polymerase subunit P [Candidatus Aenigmatarchaeota archaeon]
MTLKCVNCGKETEKIIDRVRCPFCGFRVFVKKRPKIIKKVQAR